MRALEGAGTRLTAPTPGRAGWQARGSRSRSGSRMRVEGGEHAAHHHRPGLAHGQVPIELALGEALDQLIAQLAVGGREPALAARAAGARIEVGRYAPPRLRVRRHVVV